MVENVRILNVQNVAAPPPGPPGPLWPRDSDTDICQGAAQLQVYALRAESWRPPVDGRALMAPLPLIHKYKHTDNHTFFYLSAPMSVLSEVIITFIS